MPLIYSIFRAIATPRSTCSQQVQDHCTPIKMLCRESLTSLLSPNDNEGGRTQLPQEHAPF